MRILFALTLLLSASIGQAQEKTVTVGLIGDSTVAEQSGWGPAFAERIDSGAKIINYAKNGATMESLSKKLDELVLLKPDYVLIQFGHNDQKRYDTKVYTDHLQSYVQRIQKAGSQPIIVSSVTRRSFDEKGKIVSNLVQNERYNYKATLTDYANAAEAVAKELNLPFIDLHKVSIAHHNQIGPEASMAYNFKEGDKTHFNKKGAEAIADLLLGELKTAVPQLAGYVKAANESATRVTKILFLGNSYTARHDIAGLVEQILEEGDPSTDVQVQRVIYGGQNMFKHSTYYFSQSFIEQSTITEEILNQRIETMKGFLQSETAPNPKEWDQHWAAVGKKDVPFSDIYRHIKSAIRNHESLLQNNPRNEWDYVVLQSWRDVSNQPNQGYERYATKLARIAKKQGAEVILYMTSPETQNQDPVTGPYNVESAKRDTAVGLRMAKALQPKAVIPVPLAIKNIQTGSPAKPGTDLVFRYHNDGHPNQTCAFLVTNLFYAALTGKSPEGLEFNTVVETKVKNGKDPDGGELKVVFEGKEKAYLQRMAWEAVTEFSEK